MSVPLAGGGDTPAHAQAGAPARGLLHRRQRAQRQRGRLAQGPAGPRLGGQIPNYALFLNNLYLNIHTKMVLFNVYLI